MQVEYILSRKDSLFPILSDIYLFWKSVGDEGKQRKFLTKKGVNTFELWLSISIGIDCQRQIEFINSSTEWSRHKGVTILHIRHKIEELLKTDEPYIHKFVKKTSAARAEYEPCLLRHKEMIQTLRIAYE